MNKRAFKKYGILLGLAFLLSAVFVFLFGFKQNNISQANSISLESATDSFLLTDEYYGGDEGFVYTARVSFASGQAAGIVFGGKQDESYFVLNVDRLENKVKLIYFDYDDDGLLKAEELLSDYYIGNDKATAGELELIQSRLNGLEVFYLKVKITVENGEVFGEFYVDNIKRFGVDSKYNLNEWTKNADIGYSGGYLGHNSFNSKVSFDERYIGESDFSYYVEMYRQQYHFSQFRNWNNDPNGLVYYDGYYHLFYQHNPFDVYWGDMYWGHARSTDLFTWELLPICLFPDKAGEFGSGNGYMWSGSAIVYQKGTSEDVDKLNWFGESGSGLIAYYTRDGERQNQIMMSSDDGGMTWTKRKVAVYQGAIDDSRKLDVRDPKTFVLEEDANGKPTRWGMVVSGGQVRFFQSENLLDWTFAGDIPVYGECPDLYRLPVNGGSGYKWVLQMSSRFYVVGDIGYNAQSGRIVFTDTSGNDIVGTTDQSAIDIKQTEYGKDSYAAQTFYIADQNSKYYGKTVGLSWFSGVPGHPDAVDSGALSQLRKVWNGGGMTVPVELALNESNGEYLLTQTPVTLNNTDLNKTQLYKNTDLSVDENTQNILSGVDGQQLEIILEVSDIQASKFGIRVNIGEGEYTEIGYSAQDGYYTDRRYTSLGGLSLGGYKAVYNSGVTVESGEKATLYILVDSNSIEVFCHDFTLPFYVLTFASPYSTGLEFFTDGGLTVDLLEINKINSTFKDTPADGESILYVTTNSVELDLSVATEKKVYAYATSGAEVEWKIVEGEDIIQLNAGDTDVVISALKAGSAVVSATAGGMTKLIEVTVNAGVFDTNLSFNHSGVISGDWVLTDKGLKGYQSGGDGFILSNSSEKDFIYTAKFDLGNVAAAIVFRAAKDMSKYTIANYDNNSKIVKLWTERGELARADAVGVDIKNIVLGVEADGKVIKVFLNGNLVIQTEDTGADALKEGYLGLNVCATEAVFEYAYVTRLSYEYTSGDFSITNGAGQVIKRIYNFTLKNSPVPLEMFTSTASGLTIKKEYFMTLPEAGEYTLTAHGDTSSFGIRITVAALPKPEFSDITFYGTNVSVFAGSMEITSVKVNGAAIDGSLYKKENNVLTVYKEAFTSNENTVVIVSGGDEYEFKVTAATQETGSTNKKGCKKNNSAQAAMLTIIIAGFLILKKK